MTDTQPTQDASVPLNPTPQQTLAKNSSPEQHTLIANIPNEHPTLDLSKTQESFPSPQKNPLFKQILPSLEIPLTRYDVLQILGEGGMGLVEQVQDHLLQRVVARKKIKQTFSKMSGMLSRKEHLMILRLKREGQITAILEHPNIVPLYDMQIQDSGDLSFTMRKVEGKTLRSLFNEFKTADTFEENKLLSIYFKVCEAMAYAHSRGIVHRDLKPENIMVGQFGEVYVMDWGIAKVLQEEELFLDSFSPHDNPLQTIGGIGTPGYMSPEQSQDASHVTPQSDIYALGKILRECFILYSPTEELQLEIAQLTTNSHKKHSDLEEKIPQDIRAIIQKATDEAPKKRYENVQELLQDLERYQKNLTVSARQYTSLESLQKWFQRNQQKLKITFLVFVLSIGIPLFYYFQGKQKTKKRLAFLKTQVQTSQQKALAIPEWPSKEDLENKIHYLMEAFNLLEDAIALNVEVYELETQKKQIGEMLILQTCQSEDYRLAQYIAKDLQRLKILSEPEKQDFFTTIEKAKTQQLKRHQKRLHELKTSLIGSKEKERQQALVEIAKMPEEEITQELITIVEEGTSYFLQTNGRAFGKNKYYEFFCTALGNTEHQQAVEPLKNAIMLLCQKHEEKREEEMFQRFEQFYTQEELSFLIHLTQALAHLKFPGTATFIEQTRLSLGENGTFWRQTENAYHTLARIDLPSMLATDRSSFFHRGRVHFYLKQYENAIHDFTEAFKFSSEDPSDYSLYYFRGLAYLNQGNYNEALLNFMENLQVYPEDANSYYFLGRIKMAQGDFENALLDLNRITTPYPFRAEAFYYQGVIHTEQGNDEEAIKSYEEATFFDHQYVEAYHALGLAKARQGKDDEAILHYTSALSFNPEYTDAYFYRGQSKFKKQDFIGAIADYTLALNQNPQRTQIYYHLALAKNNLGQTESAILDYTEAISHHPEDSQSYFGRGNAKESLFEHESAISDYSEAIRLAPQSLFYKQRGYVQMMLQNYQEMLSDYTQAILLDPKDGESYFYRGLAKKSLKNYESAIIDFLEAIQLGFHKATAYHTFGDTYKLLGNLDRAIEMYEAGFALESYADLSDVLKNALFLRLERHYEKEAYLEAQKDLLRLQTFFSIESEPWLEIKKKLEKVEEELKLSSPK